MGSDLSCFPRGCIVVALRRLSTPADTVLIPRGSTGTVAEHYSDRDLIAVDFPNTDDPKSPHRVFLKPWSDFTLVENLTIST